LTEFGQFGQHGEGDHRADAGNGGEAAGFLRQPSIGRDEFGEQLITLGDLPGQRFEELPGLAEAQRVGLMFGVILLGDARLEQLPPPLRQVGQPLLGGRGRGGGLERAAIGGQHGGINGIGLGAPTWHPGEVTDAGGFDDADGETGGVEGAHDRLFVTARGFANDVRPWSGAQAFDEVGMTCGIVGQGMLVVGELQLQSELGNIQADMQDGGIVRTHTCRIRATMIFKLSCSSNGSSWGQWARREQASKRIPPKADASGIRSPARRLQFS
jgi:hypothetical protein